MTSDTRLEGGPFASLVGASSGIRQVLELAGKVAPTDATVLILGESGTGKELLARAIHDASPRAAGPFVKVDCTALPEELLESELFGYEKGAFTDAHARKRGRFELAHHGTLFLDEVGELALPLQAKLLRVLQDKSFERVGGIETITVDTRIVAATNRNLEEALRRRRFREDLYFRLNVVPLKVPPLRERREDIAPLVRRFLASFGALHGKPIKSLHPEALALLERYAWPGNVRELEHAIERAVLVCEGEELRPEDLALDLVAVGAGSGTDGREMTLAELEREYIRRILHKVRGHKSRAAKILGINRKTLLEKRKRYGLG